MYVPSFFKLVKDWFPDIKSTMYSIFAQRAVLTQDSSGVNQLLNIDIKSLSFPANFFLFLFNNSIVPGLQINELTGIATSIIYAIETNFFNSLTDITLTDTALSISKFSSLKITDKTLNLSSVTELTGASTSISNAINTNSLNSFNSLTDITLTDTALSVSDLETLKRTNKTNKTLNLSSVTNLTGVATKIINAIDTNSFNNLTKITLTDTALSVSDLDALKRTNKTLNLSSVHNLTGVATSIIYAIDTNSFNNLTKITLTDTALSVSDLDALKKKTNKTLNLSSVTNLTGVATSIINAIDTNSFNSLTDITLTDTELSISKFISLKTTNKTLNLSSVTELTGASTSISNAINTNSFNYLIDITLTDTELFVKYLEALIAVIKPRTIINATSVKKLNGDRDQILNLNKKPNIILLEAVIPKFWSNPFFIGGGIIGGIVGVGGFIYYLRKRNTD